MKEKKERKRRKKESNKCLVVEEYYLSINTTSDLHFLSRYKWCNSDDVTYYLPYTCVQNEGGEQLSKREKKRDYIVTLDMNMILIVKKKKEIRFLYTISH